MKKSQTWSLDIMLALVVLISAVFVIYAFFGGSRQNVAKELQKSADNILNSVSSSDSKFSIVDGVNINETKLQEMLNEQYPELKSKIRAENDFCIFLEDESGNIIYISNKPGIGSNKIKVSDMPCE